MAWIVIGPILFLLGIACAFVAVGVRLYRWSFGRYTSWIVVALLVLFVYLVGQTGQ